MTFCKEKSLSFISESEEETKGFALSFSEKLLQQKTKIVAFSGDLGAGKTRFIKGMLNYFSNVEENEVISPTFTYMNIYPTEPTIYHFDLYRIPNEDVFISMGFEEYFEKDGICLIEWADNISRILPKNTIRVGITILDETKRKVEIYEHSFF